jgi:hypothetical protein
MTGQALCVRHHARAIAPLNVDHTTEDDLRERMGGYLRTKAFDQLGERISPRKGVRSPRDGQLNRLLALVEPEANNADATCQVLSRSRSGANGCRSHRDVVRARRVGRKSDQ